MSWGMDLKLIQNLMIAVVPLSFVCNIKRLILDSSIG